ncbi:MAG: valyl-tRNA synthetase [Chthoniobacter sp.]|nr:valyl-tRNA synthetase [Chthoniobacter sp.]
MPVSELSKAYEPNAVEEKWYAEWLAGDFFKADPQSPKPAYSIVIPPPNVTGMLTLGHVLNITIQDILARRARMLGKEVLWLPGTDHAGIATQTVVERTLKKQGAIRHRDDLGREKFLDEVWKWKEEKGGIIIQQLKKLGASCDWSRERFTMDAEYSRCVQQVFVDLYKKGLIYRGKRMVNWCPVSLTALSDEEVIMKPQNGTMYFFKVEIAEMPGTFLTIATTRPETIPGDTAVAVNPRDERYAQLIGKHVVRPLPAEVPREQRLIPIIGDEHVEFEFGTGVLKVTPAHDKADFDIWARARRDGIRRGIEELRQMEPINIMNPDGTMNAFAGEALVGLDRFEARNVAADSLRNQLRVLEKEEPYQNNVGYSERADVPIEPRLSEQWFLKCPQVEKSRNVVASGTMRFYPERWEKVYDHWLEGIQDWCVSRQLWWGHQIPVWRLHNSSDWTTWPFTFARDELPTTTDLQTEIGLEQSLSKVAGHSTFFQTYLLDTDLDIFASTTSELEARELQNLGFERDPDVLDTWFSSWLWPFATMGWPEKTDTLAKFYPTTDLVTGPDIIFFWVARMIMAGFEWMGEMPFRNVYFTGIIRDKQGRKMSKSLGNSPDPLDLIAKFGADALRFGVMRSAPLGADILFDEKNVELGRNFCTKLWNAARFRQMQGGESENEINAALLTSDDKWILLRLDAAIREISAALDEYRFSDAAQKLYAFFWSEFCDWYLEASKAALNSGDAPRKANTLAVIDFLLGHTLRLMHPFLPFITEELWHALDFQRDMPDAQGGRTIMFAPWPQPLGDDFRERYALDDRAERFAISKYELVNQGRTLRRNAGIASKKRVRFVLQPQEPLPAHEQEVLKILLNAEPLEVVGNFDAPKGTPTAPTALGTLFLPLEGLVDFGAERERLQKEMVKIEAELVKVRAKLANPSFVEKVPRAVFDEHRQRESAWAEKLAQLQKLRDGLGA